MYLYRKGVNMKKFVSLLLSGLMICSLSVPTFGLTVTPVDMDKVSVGGITQEIEKIYNLPNGLKSFKDVHSSFWAYDAIMSMTEKGLFAGTTEPIDGIGTFNPNGVMTRAQFITVITRALFANSLANMTTEGPWYAPNWNIAVETGILKEEDLGGFENSGLKKLVLAIFSPRIVFLFPYSV